MSLAKIPSEVLNRLKDGTVLVLWGAGSSPEDVQRFSQELSTQQCSRIIVEHFERLILCKSSGDSCIKHSTNYFCFIYCS